MHKSNCQNENLKLDLHVNLLVFTLHGLLNVISRIMFTKLKLLSKTIRPPNLSHISFQSTQFPIWVSGPEAHSSSPPSSPSVMLFGFAGSSPHHLAKQAAVYSSLGYTSLSCIMPERHLFCYDVSQAG